jgi:hypothetical protein
LGIVFRTENNVRYIYDTNLFVIKHQSLQDGQLNDIFKKFMRMYYNLNLGVREYRQICSVIGAHYFSESVLEDTELNEVWDLQAGHTTATREIHYNKINSNIGSQTVSDNQYYHASRNWHQLFEMIPNNSRTISAERMNSSTHPDTQESIQTITNISNLEQYLSNNSDQTLINMEFLIEANSAIRNINYTEFTCQEQYIAMAKIIEAQDDLIVVIGTGKGKSALFIAPATNEQNKITVCIPLFNGLFNDLLTKCSQLGVRYSVWGTHIDRTNCENLLFVSATQANSLQFRSFLTTLYHSDRLKRIVIDEAHELILSHYYRSELHELRTIRNMNSLVPIVLLSATLSPHHIDQLNKAFHTTFKTIMGSLNRPNLIYYRFTNSSYEPGNINSFEGIFNRFLGMEGHGIIYCPQYSIVDNIHDSLKQKYHYCIDELNM